MKEYTFDSQMSFRQRVFNNLSIFLILVLPVTLMGLAFGNWTILLLVASLLSLIWLASSIKRSKYYLALFHISNDIITLRYFIYNKEYFLQDIPNGRLRMTLETKWYDAWGARILTIYMDDKLLLKQHPIGNWTEAEFTEIVKSI